MDSNGLFDGTGGIIILILFLLLIGGGNFLGGNNNAAMMSALQGGATRADVNEIITQQNIENAIVNSNNNVNSQFANANLANSDNFANVQQTLAALGYQQSSCCCDIKSTLLADGQLTRNMLQEQTIQALRDKLADKDKDLLLASLTASQVAQTAQLENYIDSKLSSTTTTPANG